jgi:hypothetical protein
MAGKEELTLQAFHVEVEQCLASYSAEELRTVLRAMARKTLPEHRQAFLEDLKWVAADEQDVVGPGFA